MNPRLSIVIPTWNQKDLLTACLRSLYVQTFRDFETVVVDDGSTDDTAKAIERDYPEARLVRLPENRGFCVAANAGIREASGEFILLLNNDMTLDADCLARLVAAADASDAALLAPLVLWRDDPSHIYGAGDRQCVNGRPESIGFRCALDGFVFPEAIFGVSAGAGLYRRAVFDRIGLLDERFIAYFEDSDLNFRARLAGFGAALVPEARAYHVGAASIEGRTWWRTRQCCRNHALLVIKNMPRALFLKYLPAIVAERWHHVRRVFSACRAEFGSVRAVAEVVSVCYSLARALPHVLGERSRIQRSRVISIHELEMLLTKNGD